MCECKMSISEGGRTPQSLLNLHNRVGRSEATIGGRDKIRKKIKKKEIHACVLRERERDKLEASERLIRKKSSLSKSKKLLWATREEGKNAGDRERNRGKKQKLPNV